MKCVYVNLAHALERKEELELNFKNNAPLNWSIERFEAIDKNIVLENQVPGKLRPEEKACFMSHAQVIRQSRDVDGHVLILEDDAQFGPSSFEVVDSFIREDLVAPWDILFTDVGVPSPSLMVDLLKARRELEKKKKCIAIDLSVLSFYGATAYIVNKNSKRQYH
jgi:GR25 family glycosyltransferase involved in LPS biosynthesis